MGLRELDHLRDHDRRLAEVETRVARYPIREGAAGGVGNVVSVVTGDAVGDITAVDSTFEIDGISVLAGTDPGDPVTVQNTLAQAYDDNETLIAYQFEEGGDWHTDKVGSGTGDSIAEFELTENMAYADTYKLAKPLDGSHNLDSGATAVRLLDLDGKWFGLAAYTSTSGSERGYRFFARFVTSDHDSSGVAGWEIIAGEGPAPLVRGTLVTWTSTSNVAFNVSPDRALGGGWAAGRLPEEESGSFDLTATDEDSLAMGAPASTAFLLAWSRTDETYRVVAALRKHAALAYTYTSITAASSVSGTLTPGSGDVYLYDAQGDGTWDKQGVTITAYNSVDVEVSADKVVQLKNIDGYLFVDVEPCS